MTNNVERGQRVDRLGMRLPEGMMGRIKVAAAEDSRTVTSWVEKTLRDALEASEARRKRSRRAAEMEAA
jgi:hypothetical protein